MTDYSISINYKNKNKINLPKTGTSYYMRPEVLNKSTILSKDASKIDVYSIGILLYRLAFGDYPYKLKLVDSKNYEEIYNNIKQNELEFPKNFNKTSKSFLNLIKNCLEKDLYKRYDIYKLINDPWCKGYNLIKNEKEKLYNAGKFIIDLMTDNFYEFNRYVKNI